MRSAILTIVLLTLLPCLALGQRPDSTVAAPSADLAAARATSDAMRVALGVIRCLADEPAPEGFSAQAREEYDEHTAWLVTVRDRIRAHLRKRDGSFGERSRLGGADLAARMAALSTEFLELQTAVLSESRKFQTLSNASQARHDIAMNAIRNMKA